VQKGKKMMNRNIPYYLTAVGFFVLLKIGFTFADNNHLIFLLKSTDKLVGLLIGSQSVFLAEDGFFHEAVGIITYFSFLIFAYYLIDKFLKHKIYAQPT